MTEGSPVSGGPKGAQESVGWGRAPPSPTHVWLSPGPAAARVSGRGDRCVLPARRWRAGVSLCRGGSAPEAFGGRLLCGGLQGPGVFPRRTSKYPEGPGAEGTGRGGRHRLGAVGRLPRHVPLVVTHASGGPGPSARGFSDGPERSRRWTGAHRTSDGESFVSCVRTGGLCPGEGTPRACVRDHVALPPAPPFQGHSGHGGLGGHAGGSEDPGR